MAARSLTPVSGPHRYLVDFPTGQTGSATIQVWSLPADVAGSMPTTGTATTITNTVPGQDGRYTFTGTVGQRIFLKTTRTSTNFRPAIAWTPTAARSKRFPEPATSTTWVRSCCSTRGHQVHVDFLVRSCRLGQRAGLVPSHRRTRSGADHGRLDDDHEHGPGPGRPVHVHRHRRPTSAPEDNPHRRVGQLHAIDRRPDRQTSRRGAGRRQASRTSNRSC